MPNWKNRTMMMNSGGSVNNNRMIDLLRRAKDERIDLGPLYSDKNSRGASFRTKKGILDLIQDRNSGKKSLKYSSGPLSVEGYTDDPQSGSGVKAGIKLRFSKGGPVQGFANGGKVTDRFKDTPGPFQSLEDQFGEGQFILPKEYEGSDDGGALSALTRFPYSNLPLGPEQGDFYTKGRYAGRKKTPLRRRMENPERMSNRIKSLPGYELHEAATQLQETKERLKEIQFSLDNESFTLNPKRKKRLEDMRDKFSNYVQIGTENLSFLAQPLVTEMDNQISLSKEGIGAARNSTIAEDGLVTDPAELLGIQAPDISIGSNSEEITKNINDAADISEVIESIDGIEQGPVTSNNDSTEPSNEKEEEEELRQYLNDIADEQAIDTGSYSPEAQRAGQVAAMYGQVAPGQIGGMGASLARGAAAAEGVQQKIDADTRASVAAVGTAVAKEQAKLKGTGVGGSRAYEPKPIELSLGRLGGNPYMVKAYVPKNQDGSGNERLASGQAANVVREVVDATKGLQNTVSILDFLSENADKATGGPAAGIALLNDALSFIGLSPSLSGRQEADALVDFQNLIVAKPLLGEGGKTISDNERQMVKNAIGQASAFKSPAVLRARIREIKNKMVMSLQQHRSFLTANAREFDEINQALDNLYKQEGMQETDLTQTQYKKDSGGIFRIVK